MGMDAIELILDVEEEFQIRFPRDYGVPPQTVGDMHRTICGLLEVGRGIVCPNLILFGKLRRALAKITGLPIRSIRLQSDLNDLLPRDRRMQDWQQIQTELYWSLPELQRPPGQLLTLISVAMKVGFVLSAGCIWLVPQLGPLWLMTSVILWGLAVWLLVEVTARSQVLIPAGCQTVRATLLHLRTQSIFGPGPEAPPVDPAKVWRRLQSVVARCLVIEEEVVLPEARFSEDLHLN